MNASAAGKWIYFNKAVPSIQKRPCLQKQILAHTTLVKGRGLPPLAMQTDIPTSRVIPYMRRFTKALLYLFYPDYNYCSDTFGAVRDSLADWKAELPLMKYESRGRAVFEVWHNLDTDEDGIIAGLWIYRFYGDSVFTCRHSAKPRFTVEYPKGYKEYPKLPKYL
jgi:hypothetical protein